MSRSFLALPALSMLALVACSASTQGINTDAGGKPVCSTCDNSAQCGGEEVCAQLDTNDFCLQPCLFSTDCSAGFECNLVTTYNGHSVTACTATSGPCGQLATPGMDGGTTTGDGPTPDGYCGSLAGPNVSGTGCHCGSGHTCTANNCYTGWYCDTVTDKCVSPPSASSCTTETTPDAGQTMTTPDAGTVISKPDAGTSTPGSITAQNGGTADTLYFAVVGDTRSANDNDPSGYPTTIINAIYAAIAALNPPPQFVIGTGDYQYADPGSGYNTEEIGWYMSARAQWKGIFWPAMGNHECDGYTASNCAPDSCTVSSDGYGNCPTTNITAFLSAMMTPIGETLPYYVRNVNATDGSWTSKFIFAASNYWDSTQESWYEQQLAVSTTYTFIMDHEYNGAGSPGDTSIFSDAQNSPHTIHIVGHTHTWEQQTDGIIVGNGGAPVTGGAPYGFTTFQRRASDGAIVVTGYSVCGSSNSCGAASQASGEQFCITATGGSVSTCP